jgi:predicted naringenin-chalcone synthase
MIPSLDAFLINRFRMRQDTKRLPITELGCAAGAMAMARANEYLKAYPDHKVVVMAVELPSLTCQTKDFRVANLVSAALFGDGGAALLMSGEPGPCEILENQTHFFYDTPELMGFELDHRGFKIILDKKISDLVLTDFLDPVKAFLARQDMSLDDIRHYVFHPGGRRIMDNLCTVLEIEEKAIVHSRNVLRQVGNLSSASVIWVLHETLKDAPDGPALMGAFGPGFNAELLTGHFYA